ncbi:pentatricopeptide repeat-containing protein At2g13600 [Nymphaea colorata]|nr:pentatricopeptide repeat-containing protein At2g13600 [Nymphaea colorata]XP_031503628.1 pentatricopeptide repeat-containing protein At2g13600 [Nymphaea colorata]
MIMIPNSSVFAKLLNSCIDKKSVRNGWRVHARIIKSQFYDEVFILNRLIDMYSKCGCLDDARQVFDKMPERNTFSWNAMITGYAKMGDIEHALQLFHDMPSPDEVSWNAIISGFSLQSHWVKALQFFAKMHSEGFGVNLFSVSSALSSCAGVGALDIGLQIHGSVVHSPVYCNYYVGSALIDMYAKCGEVESAQSIFEEMPERNIVSWNTLITCYAQNGPADRALQLFSLMSDQDVCPDEVTLSSVVNACSCLSAVREGAQLHALVIKSNFEDDMVLGNALVDMYAKCNRIGDARQVFDRMPLRDVVSATSLVCGYAKAANIEDARRTFSRMAERNVVSWNALIAGYTQNDQNEEALNLFQQLKRESFRPTHYTFGNVLNACANLADLQHGKQLHGHVIKHGFQFKSGPECDIFVGNSLIDMYAKCGSVEDAYQAFVKMKERDRVSWNVMIVGYAQNGHSDQALTLFNDMVLSGEKPDGITMIGVLCACSHTGLVDEGWKYFDSMTSQHGLIPSRDHYTCMVDILGRAGRLDEAEQLVKTMPIPPDAILWGSLLSACKVHGNVELGKRVAEKLFELDPQNSGPYVLLSNIYAETGKWREAIKIRRLMKDRGVIKQPGCSWIEVGNEVHVFMVKDTSHPQMKEIYRLLQMLEMETRNHGYFGAASSFLFSIVEENTE